jgi:rhamnose transport system permease protein
LLLLASIAPALIHLRIEAYWEKAIQGMIILLAVVADSFQSRRPTAERVTLELPQARSS